MAGGAKNEVTPKKKKRKTVTIQAPDYDSEDEFVSRPVAKKSRPASYIPESLNPQKTPEKPIPGWSKVKYKLGNREIYRKIAKNGEEWFFHKASAGDQKTYLRCALCEAGQKTPKKGEKPMESCKASANICLETGVWTDRKPHNHPAEAYAAFKETSKTTFTTSSR